ncbi:SET and MYND domain-containing protein 3 [Fukomys damarensis]|uniref:[histone H3]-lysine(4) N-trimethyltransferase n=1 Tax=Fukomys damarensis TaxID=885580 RepID=A0A091D050_FUKDA|nr:SET and MYND domain-containing protein 3 [Fukomys damarensis]
MQEVGVGLYPSMSLLNHSCDPNCSIVFTGPHLLLRAVRDIEVGEELTICYLDILMTSEERRKQLRDQYCFDCDCFRCQTQDKTSWVRMSPQLCKRMIIRGGATLAVHYCISRMKVEGAQQSFTAQAPVAGEGAGMRGKCFPAELHSGPQWIVLLMFKKYDADMLTGDEQVWKGVQESLKKIEELKAHWKWEQVLAMCQSIIRSNSERLPDINIYQLKVLDCAMDACINLGLLEEALFYGVRTMEPYRYLMTWAGEQQDCLTHRVTKSGDATIASWGKQEADRARLPNLSALLSLQAFDIMRVTHGREHSLIEDLILLLEECDANIRAS